MELKVLLADDEDGILDLLERTLSAIPDVSVTGKAHSVQEAINLVMEHDFDMAILDIELPDGSGLGLAKELKAIDPDLDIVFATAHSQFALDSFEYYPSDYILKPIDKRRVVKTIKRIQKERENNLIDQTGLIMRKLSETKYLSIKNGQEIILIDPKDILFLESVGRKVIIHCTGNNKYDTWEPLQDMETKLGNHFFRSHKSFIINLKCVKKIIPWSNQSYQIQFREDCPQAQLSRRRVGELLEKLSLVEGK
ncbi:MAG: LytR/AlgR family response regulator transcription factor [Bacillota bacterium]